ncbi:MAG: M23 family metallopeptidase [Steroidobacteraceae bacterium]
MTGKRELKYGPSMSLLAKTSLRALARSPVPWLLAGVVAVAAWALLKSSRPALHVSPAPATQAGQLAAAAPGSRPARGLVPAAEASAPGSESVSVTIGRNDTLDRLFHHLHLSLADLAAVRSLPGLKGDLDRLRPGESLTLVHRGDELLGLTRRLSLAQTLRVAKTAAGYQAQVIANPLETRTRTISGRIDHSLFEAMTEAGGHDSTTMALADIFAWDIDFVNDIQPGDTFTVTYQEIYDHGRYAQDGPILAARFVNEGHEYLAVRYVSPDGAAGYYTPDGRSLRKAFLRAPLEFTRISSPFSLHRRHPILHLIRAHKGVDFAAPIGTPVKAAGDGRVAFVGRKGGYGNVVELDHAHGIMTVYGHLSRFAHGLRVGEHVAQGTVIAYVGMTGLATGPHLHYEFRVDGVAKNPQTVSLPDAAPIGAGLRTDFLAKTAPLLVSLFPPAGPALVSR